MMNTPGDVPFSQEAEEAVIGAVLINPNSFLTVAAFLTAEDFYLLRHKYIWEALSRLHERRDPIDNLTLARELEETGHLDNIGGPAYLIQLLSRPPTSAHAEVYGRIVERTALRRRLMVTADEIRGLALDEDLSIETVTDQAETALFQVTDRQTRREFISMNDAVNAYFDRIEHLMDQQTSAMGAPSGFRDLDALLGGFQRSDLLIFAGRPGMGKCVAAGTRIHTTAGKVPIESLLPHGVPGIQDEDGGVYYPAQVALHTPQGIQRSSHVYDSGPRPTLTLQTAAGHTLTATTVHPLRVMTPGGPRWRALAALQPGDHIAVQAAHGGLAWQPVLSVTPAGIQHCYDLTVPQGRQFFANDVLSHNTSFMLTTAVNMARLGQRVAIFTMEMGHEQLVQRMIAMETGISTHKLRLGQLSQVEYSRFVEAAGRVSRFPIFIDDTPALNPTQMRTKCRRLQHEHGIDVVFVDYLQLMNAGGQYQNNRVQEVSYISRALKELARELNIPLFSAAQLSRAVEQRQDKRPVLSDLRESGSLEQDADIVMFLYRDAVYNEASEFPNQADVIIAKHRNGPTGTISLYFEQALTKFMDGVTRRVDLGEMR